MEPIQTKYTYRVDLDFCPTEAALPRLLSHSDALADEIIIPVRRGQTPVDLTGMTALATITYATRQTLPIQCQVAANTITVTLPAEAYAVPGAFRLCVQLHSGDVRHTLLRLTGHMAPTAADTLISSGDLLPTLPELLGQIDGMQEATVIALQAAEAAQTATADMAAQVNLAAPAILLTAQGDAPAFTDAAARPAVAVVTTVTAIQSGAGTPSQENPMPILPCSAASLSHADVRTEDAIPIATMALPGVYGGTLDWVTGALTITHASIALDSSTLYWNSGSRNFYVEIPEMLVGSQLLSDQFVSTSAPSTKLALGQMTLGSVGSGGPRVCFGNPEDALTRDEWLARCDAQPIQLVYELAEPVTVQLTAQQIPLLAGSNALWSDAGQTAVTYVADTRTYIDNAVAALAAAIISA